MVRFAGYARKKEPRWPYVAMAFVILMAAAVVLFIFSAVAQWLESEANKPVTTTTTTVSTTVSTTTIAPIVTTTSLPPIVSATGIKVDQIVIASGIDDANQPLDDLAKVPVGKFSKIYCYTRMSNTGKAQAVRHIWTGPGGKALAEIELTARGGASATWSYVNVSGLGAGQWQVRVETKDGTVLAKRIFVTF